ncbi:serine-rich adhesin for platelets-like [Argopecten irradians]|uniref:serine-rich adhesin for platelets-like n=1 Tax=Argopecten irradians TaxID=31199 RepID=UPI003721BD3A
MNWTEATDYCYERNGRLIVLDSQKKWEAFTSHAQYNEFKLSEGVYWMGMRFNDSFNCTHDGYSSLWLYNGWSRWGRWNDFYVEPDGCKKQECVQLRDNMLFSDLCYLVFRALCEADTSRGISVPEQMTTDPPSSSKTPRFGAESTDVSTSAPKAGVSSGPTSTFQPSEMSSVSASTSTSKPDVSPVSTSLSSREEEPTSSAFSTSTLEMIETSDTTNSPTTTAQITARLTNTTCSRCCPLDNRTKNYQFDIERSLRMLRRQLAVNRTDLSARKRKLISVYDSRPSSVAMGGVACVLLATVATVIVIPDAFALCRYVYRRYWSHRISSHRVKL